MSPAPLPPNRPLRRRRLTASKLFEILWNSAWEASLTAFLALLLGRVAIGTVGGLWQKMAPSPPPLLTSELALAPGWEWLRHAVVAHRFAILFGLIFAVIVGGRLIRYAKRSPQREAAAWFFRVSRRLSDEWFGLIVFNAFVAMATAVALQAAGSFTLTKLALEIAWNILEPLVGVFTAQFHGKDLWEGLGGMASWYSDNQLKFSFWLVYAGLICDDLGLPNIKSLARWLWRRLSRRKKAALTGKRNNKAVLADSEVSENSVGEKI